MPVAAIHVIPDGSFEDWAERGMSSAIIRPVNPPSIAEPLAQKLRGHLVVYLPDGRVSRKSFV